MGYNAQIIGPQLHKASTLGLRIIANQHNGSPEMNWLIGREKAWRLRWPDNYETSLNQQRQKEEEALLSCARTRADRSCERATSCQGCQGCPYESGSFTEALPPWLPFTNEYEKQFYDVRVRSGRLYVVHLKCWPNDGLFHAKSGEVIKSEEVIHYRLSFAAEPAHVGK